MSQDPNLISITRPTGANPPKQETKFHTEVIGLPTNGYFYDESNPLSKGTIEIHQLTAKHEDIINSANLIKKGMMMDKLLESVIVDKTIHVDEILECDKNALLYAIRMLAYGNEYNISSACPKCDKQNHISIDLGTIKNRDIDFSKYTKGKNSFEFMLPISKINITFKLLTKKDQDIIDGEIEAFSKITKEQGKNITTLLTQVITGINGDSDKMRIRKFVNDELLSRDSMALRKHIKEEMPDVDWSYTFHCQYCEYERREAIPIGLTFFWPNSTV